MRKQALMIAGLGLLLMQGALWSQEMTVSQEMTLKIMNLKYYPVQEMSRILETISGGDGTQTVVDEKTNCLIVRATPDRMVEIEQLVAQLDTKTESVPQGEPLLCRVYMVELAAPQSDLKSFKVALQVPSSVVSLPNLLKASEGKKVVIDAFRDDEPGLDDPHKIEIEGRAASIETITQVLDIVPSPIANMEFDEQASELVVPAAQISQLPEQLRQHIHKFLGADVQTVGYWFGSMSSPGEIKAPIGPWSIQLEVKPTQTTALSIEVGVDEWEGDNAFEILRNSIQGKVGKPIIIGYNREVNNVRTMGAMIVLLEADTTPGQ
ncbi:MAG: secretin N-terminal domain-containing protein [Phycisphaerales bacterium]